ncbi:ParA family protein [Rhodococcus sp. BP-252]|uniref:ParA family protein n=1 Tax=unclassified Rhodococcus (in: high G+C Gram-positive bacteria) TaxID=192944 RepID=UPI001C9B07B6|nr:MULTISPECIES: ParA family protein [unclassified Rhodococcus (in: high G+C Gram-positive bacteria)]MBY6418622.1 ParA family protein [Rhodococcus sp. BP-321]MBY6428734.1 ParA family protein [Rhodococcus sp. BP-323]MBY6433743.1 ParA family protein [Rhodococcus sp. BP-322]MBY6442673.1 ParA family protein [Rhodococcus sp. BP-319]MBY6452342.1 ParA family protein [Rhodococcus sp. BP-315]MBY6462319.1 ParA family protein [Rhodococcus sp. BP-260]MBY6471769.1 ParA family protein [Rhodococcus sp. BP-
MRVTTTGTSRTVLVANQKGGVGKSSIVSAVAGMVAATGRRVLVVDADQQANVSSSDLGVEGDGGRGLSITLQYGQPLTPVRSVRPNLDVIPGGPALAVISAVAATAAQTNTDLRANLTQTLNELNDAENYDLVLIDSGPGDAPLLDALLGTARYLVVPTKDDDASLSGVELLAMRYLRARQAGSLIQLLGVVLFDTNPRATARNREVFEQVNDLLEGSGADPFETFIRSDRAAAVDLRTRHLTPLELVEVAESDQKNRLQRLRQKGKAGDRLWSRDPSGLASDYQALTREILRRVSNAERDRVAGGVS